jgi:hypothetical protein
VQCKIIFIIAWFFEERRPHLNLRLSPNPFPLKWKSFSPRAREKCTPRFHASKIFCLLRLFRGSQATQFCEILREKAMQHFKAVVRLAKFQHWKESFFSLLTDVQTIHN